MEEQKAFKLVAPYQPTGDQPQAIDALVKGLEHGDNGQVLLGVTGSGKTFTMANVIQKVITASHPRYAFMYSWDNV